MVGVRVRLEPTKGNRRKSKLVHRCSIRSPQMAFPLNSASICLSGLRGIFLAVGKDLRAAFASVLLGYGVHDARDVLVRRQSSLVAKTVGRCNTLPHPHQDGLPATRRVRK